MTMEKGGRWRWRGG